MTSLVHWLLSRLKVADALRHALEKPVPLHRRWPFYLLGGACLFLMSVQVLTGVLLALYYHPTPGGAHASVARIMGEIPYGWLVRSVHARGADLLVMFLLWHLVSTFFMRSYRPPRELTWITGFAVLFLVLGFCFSGSLFPWDTFAYFATQVGTQDIGTLPVVGEHLVKIVRGGEHVSADTLTRFYVAHVVLLPLAALALIGLHLLLVQQHGMSVPPGTPPGRWVPFYPHVAALDGVVWLLVLAVLAALAACVPCGLGAQCDPLAPAPPGIRPEWYFTPVYETLRLLPSRLLGLEGAAIGNVAFGLLTLFWLTVPFWDRAAHREESSSWVTLFGLATIAWCVGVTAYSYYRSWGAG